MVYHWYRKLTQNDAASAIINSEIVKLLKGGIVESTHSQGELVHFP